MGKRLTDILPKISQWEGIEYAGDFNCPYCDKSGFYDLYGEERMKPNMVGWCETHIGYMGVFECPVCFENIDFTVQSELGLQILMSLTHIYITKQRNARTGMRLSND